MRNQETGKQGEEMAAKYLEEKGYELLECNARRRIGEIDLIMRDPHADEIVFVEVKTRTGEGFGHPEEAVNTKKLEKITKIALLWVQSNSKEDAPLRIDVISIGMDKDGTKITHLKNVTAN